MRIGISVSSSIDARTPQEAMAAMVERARSAYSAGLASLTVGDHHVMSRSYMQNTPTLGRLIAEWPDRPAGCLFLLPLWNPVLVAEHIGTLAAMTDAPFIVQTGIGSGATQFEVMGADLRTRGRSLEDAIGRVRALLDGSATDGAQINPVPGQAVEWWIGAGSAPAALERAGRLGDAWYAPPTLTAPEAPPMLDAYLRSCAEHDRAPRPIVRKDVLISDRSDHAGRRADELVGAGYRGMGRDQVIAGGPEQVAESLRAFAELGFHEVVVRCMAVSQREALETIESLAEVRDLVHSS